MAINYPGPYELQIEYQNDQITGVVLPHIQRLNIALVETAAQGDTFANYNIKDKDGDTTVDLATVVEDYLTIFNDLFISDMDIISVELWKYPTPQSYDAVFWSSYVPTANVGTGVVASQSAGQDIYSFRTQEGGTMKLSLMEDQTVPGAPVPYASLGAKPKALVDYVLGGDGSTYNAPFLGRDTSYPFSFNRQFPGRNEKLWKTRNGR